MKTRMWRRRALVVLNRRRVVHGLPFFEFRSALYIYLFSLVLSLGHYSCVFCWFLAFWRCFGMTMYYQLMVRFKCEESSPGSRTTFTFIQKAESVSVTIPKPTHQRQQRELMPQGARRPFRTGLPMTRSCFAAKVAHPFDESDRFLFVVTKTRYCAASEKFPLLSTKALRRTYIDKINIDVHAYERLAFARSYAGPCKIVETICPTL